MHAVVSLLDGEHGERVRALWDELARHFGLHGVFGTPFPHFSYHVARDYDLSRLSAAVAPIAQATKPFTVHMSGLGIFPGPEPVLYLSVARSPRLTRLHQALWPIISGASEGAQGYYHPDRWMPHITIGYGDVSHEKLAAVVGELSRRSLSWEIPVSNLAAIFDREGEQGVAFRMGLSGGNRGPS